MGKKNFKKRQTKPPGKLNIFVVDLDSRLHHVDSLEFAALFRLFPSASLLVAHLGLNPVRVRVRVRGLG